MNTQTILVTGGTGFIGRHLTRTLADQPNTNVICVDYDLDQAPKDLISNPSVDIYELDIRDINKHQPLVDTADAVYHLAGLLGTTELYSQIIEAERINVIGTIKLLEAMRKTTTDRLVYMSKPNLWEQNVYTITKMNAERYVDAYADVYEIDATTVRPFNVYGPEERIDKYRKAIPYFIVQALQDEPLEVFGTGEQTMDLVYVEDVARILGELGTLDDAIGNTIEVGTGSTITVNTIAELIIEIAESDSEIRHVPMRTGEDMDSHVEANPEWLRTNDALPETTLREGLERTIRYYERSINEYAGDIYEFEPEFVAP